MDGFVSLSLSLLGATQETPRTTAVSGRSRTGRLPTGAHPLQALAEVSRPALK